MGTYSMIFQGSVDDFVSSAGAEHGILNPSGLRQDIEQIFGRYMEEMSGERGICSLKPELYINEGMNGTLRYILNEMGKLPKDAAVLVGVNVEAERCDAPRLIDYLLGDMQGFGLEIIYCRTPEAYAEKQ